MTHHNGFVLALDVAAAITFSVATIGFAITTAFIVLGGEASAVIPWLWCVVPSGLYLGVRGVGSEASF